MPSTKKQATHRTLCRCLAKSFMSFCGIASFGMINIRKTLGLAVVSTLTLALSATTISLSTPVHAVDSASASTDVTLNLGAAISVRVLDSTASQEISLLSFDLTPTSTGVTSTKTAVVDVSTSNVTGYKLYVEANGKDHNNNYTTDLVQADQDDSNVIPTSTTTTENKNFWNYVNPSLGSTSVIPAHGTPDKINQEFTPTDSTKTNIDVNIGVDTTITAGTYNNQLLFTAIANASSMGYTLNFLQNLPVGADPTTLENFPENQSASSVSTSYTFTIPPTAPSLLGYNFLGFLDPEAEPGEKGSTEDPYQAGDDVVVNADTSTSSSVMSGSKTLSADWNIITPTLTVDPAGGTWSGSTEAQTFTQAYGTTKTINLPSQNASYTISYNDNSQGATFTPTPTSAERSFTGWSLEATRAAGPGSWDPATSTYTFGTTNGTLSATYNETANAITLPTLTKTGYTCKWHENSASGTSHDSGETGVILTANVEFYAVCTINQYTLTVNPNGGTWNGSTSSQQFSQDYGTTKSIANPTAGPTYTIGYNMGSTGITAPTSPTSVQRPFSSWSLSGAGSFAGNTYTYEAGNGTLTASYGSTSNKFTLPALTKTGHTCKWHLGSASGTEYASGATNVTITGNSTFYATCTANNYTVNISNSNTTSGASSLSVPYGGSKTVTVTPNSGYYLSAVSCPSGYTCSGYSTGVNYYGQQTVTVKNNNTTSGGTLTFTGANRWNAITQMQQMTTATCAIASVGSSKTLTDTRDNNTYTVKKLKDGKCWMTQNLRLTGSRTLTSSNSNVSSNWTLPAANASFPASCVDTAYNVSSDNTTYGYYYNWYAATAGTGTCAMASGNATSSICPKGWRLPTGDSNGEFKTLYNNYNSPTLMMGDPAFVLSGFQLKSEHRSQGDQGRYWSSTANGSNLPDRARILYLYSSGVNPSNNDRKYYGLTVRCVAQ